ncbi:MAG: peptidoglycan synthetase, partial [Flavobacteriales bacterium]|nr:peptidoglycan synthetase [Flavobacteriales bacterium]
MNIHLIAIGGSAMHNLALALHHKGYKITGSDDAIFSPSKERLLKYDLLPKEMGWFPEKITKNLDAIILGMHARIDNPELIKAKELGIPIYSYPEYIYEQSKEKRRVVIGGSHGKTSITAMILHVLQNLNIDCDYMVGAQLEGFDTMVKLTHQAPIIILEGDEYLSSPIDRRPKFHLNHPHIAVLSGIAWDHINVFPNFGMY